LNRVVHSASAPRNRQKLARRLVREAALRIKLLMRPEHQKFRLQHRAEQCAVVGILPETAGEAENVDRVRRRDNAQ
jgi:hypothetical protein